MQISSNLLAHAQDEDLLVTEFSIIGHTGSSSSSSSSSSTTGGSSTITSGFEPRSTGSASTETGKTLFIFFYFVQIILLLAVFSLFGWNYIVYLLISNLG